MNIPQKYEALSPSDIFNIAKKTCNILKYPDLSRLETIDDIFHEGSSLYNTIRPDLPFDNNTCILLYMTRPNFGHWCTLTRRIENDEVVEYDFLDPYGDVIDDQLEFINKKFRKESNQQRAHLCRLLSTTDIPVHYNDKQLQKLDGKIATCGRYAAIFLKFNQIPVELLANTLIRYSKKYNIDIDDLVTLMTI